MIDSTIRPKEDRVEVSSDSRPERDGKSKFDSSEVSDGKVNGIEVREHEFGKNGQKMSKYKKTVESLDFLILRARLALNKWK